MILSKLIEIRVHIRAWYWKFFVGIIFFISCGVVLTNSVQSQVLPVAVIPLTPISTFDQPKIPASELNQAMPLSSSPQNYAIDSNIIPAPIPEADILFEKECTPANISLDQSMACTTTVTNLSAEEFSYRLFDLMLPNLFIVEDSVEGGELIRNRLVISRGRLAGGTLATTTISDTNKPIVYNSLAELGVPPLLDVQDESIINLSTLAPYVFNDEEYTTVGMTSNGYLIAGLGSNEDVTYIPQIFPDEAIPNNVIAPLWTDLNPEIGGNLYAALLFRDEQSWAVFEWENVPAYSAAETKPYCVQSCNDTYTFQVWLKTNTPEQDITFVYDHMDSEGATTDTNVGAENMNGTIGGNYPAIPVSDAQVSVFHSPGIAGESHEITYTAEPLYPEPWFGCAQIKVKMSDFNGISYACANGTVTE